MAVSLNERPYEVAFSKNPIRYKFSTDTALSTPGLKIDVQLWHRKFGDAGLSFVQIFELSLVPDNVGKVEIDLSKVLDSLTDYVLPVINSSLLQEAFDQSGQYYIRYREVTTATPSPAWISELSDSRVVIKGGLPHQQWQGPNYFINQTGILTWQKTGRYIGPAEKAWLTYLHLGTNNQADMSAMVNIYYTDGTSTINAVTVTFDTDVPKYGIYRVPCGSQLALKDIDPAKVIHYYTVRIVAESTSLTVEFKYVVDYRANYSKTTLYYFKSLGGFDGIRLLGELGKKTSYDRQYAEKTLGDKYYLTSEIAAMQENIKNQEQEIYSGSVGLMDDMDQYDRLRDLMLSTKVHQIKFNRWSPVVITNTSIDHGNNLDPIKDFPVEFTPGYVNESYAPDVNIGALPTCPMITGFIVTSEDGDTAPSIGWDENESHVQYVIERWDLLLSAPAEVIYTSGNTHTFASFTLGFARVRAICGFSETPFTEFISLI